mmetsp:Transcript_16268/g.15645  ORF Transcript_16268/g.15645 Transcript_16268/m.15645 type:complete len:102 (+) Transcript_16268:796-1101(+)
MDFVTGFIETTLIMDPTIFYQCEDSLTTDILPELQSGIELANAGDVYGLLNNIWSALTFLDFMIHTCYGGMVDLVLSYVDYIAKEGFSLTDLISNIIYNFP